MPNRDWRAISDVTDAAHDTGIRRYTIILNTGVTNAVDVGVPGFFNKYSFRGAKVGDLISVQDAAELCFYEITGQNIDGSWVVTAQYCLAASSDNQDASQVPMNPVLAAGAAAGAVNVQDAINALNAEGDDQTADEVPMNPVVAVGPIAGTTDVQAALEALNAASGGAVTADNVAMNPALAIGPATGQADVQAAIAAMNADLAANPDNTFTNADGLITVGAAGTKSHDLTANINLAALITALMADPAFVAGINAIITSRFSWNGTDLCFDFNENGDPST